jgi:hypothetical protein
MRSFALLCGLCVLGILAYVPAAQAGTSYEALTVPVVVPGERNAELGTLAIEIDPMVADSAALLRLPRDFVIVSYEGSIQPEGLDFSLDLLEPNELRLAIKAPDVPRKISFFLDWRADIPLGLTGDIRVQVTALSGQFVSSDAAVGTDGKPTPPGNLKAEVLSPVSVLLTWRDNSDNENGFSILRKTGSQAFAEIATVRANVSNHTVTGLSPATTYVFAVQAYGAGGRSASSNEVTVTTPPEVVPPQPRTRTVTFFLDSLVYTVDGQEKLLDAAPRILDGRLLVPLRNAAEALGAAVEWRPVSRQAVVTLKQKRVEFWDGNPVALANGTLTYIDAANRRVAPSVVAPGRMMVPVRFLAEQLDGTVKWDAPSRSVAITLQE